MRGSNSRGRRIRIERIIFACGVTIAMLCASLVSVSVISDTAEARGPAYDGPQTVENGPAFFGPAPNPFPYCDSPTYFDPFPENVSPIGRMDIGDTASVTTDGITMDLVINAEGNPGTQYPGFFPQGGDGSSSDQAKGIELAEGDGAVVTLSEPLFYSQWIFTDVDQPNEGFTVTPAWTQVGQAAAFGGDNQFTFAGTTPQAVELDDVDGASQVSQSINGRVQVDFLGAVTGIEMLRTDPSNGQSGFAVGGGCEAAGAAKVVVDGPTWNGTSYDVTYDLRVRNNLPSSSTIQSVINDAVAAVGASFVTSTPQGIDLTNLQLTDDLTDPAFSDIVVTSLTSNGALVPNPSFDGINNINLLSGGMVAAESDEVIRLSVQYTPDLDQAQWDDCRTGYTYLNQSTVTGSAAGVPISDVSDNGTSAAPSDNNGEGGVDDPTPVLFDCPPGGLQIVKTVVAGQAAACPAFDAGIPGDGPALPVTVDDFVTYCISVRNPGPGPIFDVAITDPQAPGAFPIADLEPFETRTVFFSTQVSAGTPPLNTASASASDTAGALGPVSDTALIEVSAKPLPVLEIVKTVLPGANAACPAFDDGVAGLGAALEVLDGDQVTYCISVRNTGPGDAVNVVISDPQAPQDYQVGTLLTDQSATESYTLTVGLGTAPVNVATGNYSGPDGPLDPVTDDAQIAVSPLEPALEIVKTVLPGANATCPTFALGEAGLGAALAVDDRDTVTYCVTVLNSGAGIATDVQVTDPQAPAGTFDIGTLTSGQEATVQFNLTVDIDSTPLVNTAVATGNGPTGALDPAQDQAQISIDALPDPGLAIVKTALVGPAADCPSFADGVVGAGAPVQFLETETVTYCISVRNAGPGPATDVELSDDQAPNTFDLIIGDLGVGDEVTRSYDITDLSIGDPTENIAIATGNGLNGPLDPVSDPAVIAISLQPDPILEIVKTVVSGGTPNDDCPTTFDAGTQGLGAGLAVLEAETITYCITVRNVGGNDATSVQVNDDQAPGTLQIGLLPVGEERSQQYEVVVSANTPLVNTAIVSGVGPNGAVDTDSDTALIDPSPQPDPILEIVKTVVGPGDSCPADFDSGVQGPGLALDVLYEEVVTYCITVRNIGGNPATNVTVTDPQAGAPIQIGELAVGQEVSRSYTVTVDANTPEVNTATVTGAGPNGPVTPDSDTAVIDPAPQPDPVLEIVKTVVLGASPNAACPTTFDGGTAGDGSPVQALYTETVTFCIAVRNVSGNTATDVVITDLQAPGPFQIDVLEVGQERLFEYDLVVDENTPPRNTATVVGQGPNGPTDPESDTALIAPSAQPDPILEIVKTVVGPGADCPADFDSGVRGPGQALDVLYEEVVTYCITVRNIGGNPATNVVVTDEQADGPIELGTIAIGQEVSRSYTVTVDENTPTVNTATVNGEGPNGPLAPDSDSAVIDPNQQPDPILEIVKTVVGPGTACPADFDSGVQGPGPALGILYDEVVTYCVTVRNIGENPATNVVVADDQAEDGELVLGTIDVGQEVSVSYTVTVDENTPEVNTATVTGEGPNGPVGPDSDTAVIDPDPQPDPELQIVKSVVPGPNGDCPADFDVSLLGDGEPLSFTNGDTVTYCVNVRNVGGNTATDVVVNDPQAPAPIEFGDIAVGEQASGQYDVTDVDDTTPLQNTATVTGVGPNGPTPPQTDTAVITPDPAVLEIVKTAIKGPLGECPSFDDGVVGLGDPLALEYTEVVTYCLVIKNTGGNDASGVTITDAQAGAASPFEIGMLAAGAETFVSFDLTIDADTALNNVAAVDGVGPRNTPIPTEEDPAVISTAPLPDPELMVVKTVVAPTDDCPADFDGGVVGQGDPLTVKLDEFAKYCITVKNVGDGIATDVMINDDQAPQVYDIGTLNPGQEASESYSVQIGLSTDLLNTAVVTGNGPDTTPPENLTDTDTAIVKLEDTRIASISLVHSVTKTEECITEAKNLNSLAADRELLPITWCAKITNTGNVNLTNVVLEAPDISDEDIDVLAANNLDVLAPQEPAFIFVTGVIPDTGLISRAGVSGVPSDAQGNPIPDLEPPSDADNATVVEASIQIVTTVVAGADGDCAQATEVITVAPGDEVTWCYEVTNTGSTVLEVNEVTDSVLGITVAVPATAQRLPITESFIVKATTTAEDPIEVNGDVKGKPIGFDDAPLEAPEVVDNDIAAILVPTADLSIVKTNSDNGPVTGGSILTYTLLVANAGPGDALRVTVADSLPNGLVYRTIPTDDGWVCALDGDQRGFSCLKSESMAPDTEETLTYQVTAVGGNGTFSTQLVNTVTVSSPTPDPDPTDNTSESPTSITPPPVVVVPPTAPPPPEAPPLSPPEDPPDEVLGLVVTGAASNLLALLASAMMAIGGFLTVGARRSRDEE